MSNRFKQTTCKMDWITVISNLCGAFVTMFYFATIDPSTSGPVTDGRNLLAFRIVIVVGLFVLGRFLSTAWLYS